MKYLEEKIGNVFDDDDLVKKDNNQDFDDVYPQ